MRLRTSFILWLFLLLLFLTGCVSVQPYIAPIISTDLSEFGVAGQTRCSFNNLPVSYIDQQFLASTNREFIIAHEQVHATDMKNFKGGCWPFVYKYNADKKFALDSEYRAYCIEGQLALSRNVQPEAIWARMQEALSKIDSVLAKNYKNCIY